MGGGVDVKASLYRDLGILVMPKREEIEVASDFRHGRESDSMPTR
jgi:hypothetical protein